MRTLLTIVEIGFWLSSITAAIAIGMWLQRSIPQLLNAATISADILQTSSYRAGLWVAEAQMLVTRFITTNAVMVNMIGVAAVFLAGMLAVRYIYRTKVLGMKDPLPQHVSTGTQPMPAQQQRAA